jgi:hypothetical protein
MELLERLDKYLVLSAVGRRVVTIKIGGFPYFTTIARWSCRVSVTFQGYTLCCAYV